MQDARRWYLLAVSVVAATMLVYGAWRVAYGLGHLIFPGVIMAEPPLPEQLPPEVKEQHLRNYRQQRDWVLRHERVKAFRRLAGDLLAFAAVYVIWHRHRSALHGGGAGAG